jgi:hypothetical protein
LGALDDLDRAWIATASISTSSETRATLEARGETELAAGFRRRERRRRAYLELAVLPPFLAAGALVVSGLIPGSTGTLVFATFSLLAWVPDFLRGRQIKARYRELHAAHLAAGGTLPTRIPGEAGG